MGIASKIVDTAINDTLEGLTDLTDHLQDTAENYLSLEKIIPGVIDLFVDQSKEIRNLNKELGQGSKSISAFKASIAAMSGQIGVGTRETIELLNTTKKYHQGLNETTAATLKFVKASGASSDILGNLTSKMKIMGVVSEETLTRTYENLLSVRDAYGLTNDEVDNIISSITKYTVATQASSDQIDRATISLAKFTSQLTSAGMEAERVKEIVDNMLDPDRMADNLVLMNKLGISVNDMVSGDPIAKLEGSTEKLKQLGQEIATIAKTNRFQANEMAKIYGLTLEEATTLSTLDTSERALNTQKKLDQYRNEMANFSESIKSFKDKMVGVISGPLSIFGKVLENLGNAIGLFGRGVGGIISIHFINKLLKRIRDGLYDIVGQAAKRFGSETGKYLSQTEERSKQKMADAKAFGPKSPLREGLDYGRTRNYKLNAERRRDEFNLSSGRVKPGRANLSKGEMVEFLQSEMNNINNLRKYRATLVKDSEEAKIFEDTYGAKIDTFMGKFGDVMKNMLEKSENDEKIFKAYGFDNWGKLSDKDKIGKFGDFEASLRKDFRINVDNFGLEKIDNNKIAELAGGSSGPKEFMDKLIEFYKVSNDPNAADYIKNITEQQEKYNNELFEQFGNINKLNEATKSYNKVLNDSKKGLLKNVSNFFSGLRTDIVTFAMKHFNPMKLLLGAGSIAGIGVISKLTSSLVSNLKQNEEVKEVTKDISTKFSNFLENIQPAIDGVAKFISNIYSLIEGPLNSILNWTSKVANSIGTSLGKVAGNISDSVATIEDSYKEKDLREMMLVKGDFGYDAATDSIIAKIDNVIGGIEKLNKTAQEGNDANLIN